MKKVLKNYKSTIILLFSMILGIIIGLIFKDKCAVLKPFGNLFINLLSTTIVPLIICTITLSISKIKPNKVLSLLTKIIAVFAVLSILSAIFGVISSYSYKFVSSESNIELSTNNDNIEENENYLEKTVDTLSVNDFNKLLTKDNLIAIIIASILIGIVLNKEKEKTKNIVKLIEEVQTVIMKILEIIMYYAPIGIFAFMADQVGNLGISIAADYLKVFVSYTITCLLFMIIVYSLIAIFCKKNVFTFWKESMPVILTSLSTCSSAACLPISMKVVEKLGVSEESKTTLPLGVSFHKDGSVIDSVFKIMFLVYLFNSNVSIITVILVALVATLLITAVPVGGGTLCEMMIITLLGYPTSVLPILTVIAAITDGPATLLNALGDVSATLLVDKFNKNESNI